MGLLSIFQRKDDAASEPPRKGKSAGGAATDAVQQARIRARQRLIGAVVLLGIGIIGFPLLFETQPRPIPVDIPIEIPRKDGVPPLQLPAPRAAANAASRVAEAPQVQPAASAAPVITETAAEAGRELPVPTRQPASAAAPAPVPSPAPAAIAPQPTASVASRKPAAADKPPAADKPATTAEAHAAASKPARTADDGARAKALLDGKAADSAGRFIVQVGAFAEVSAARETRLKVEKLGLKTYTQVVETDAGKRIRVRVGPFASRDEADKAASKIKAAGLGSAVLTL
jgi:DedD protein